MNPSAVLLAIGSAVLFGLAAPVAKFLLETSDPWVLAGILYCGAGLGLLGVHVALRGIGSLAEARLTRRELPWLAVRRRAGAGASAARSGAGRRLGRVASPDPRGVLTALLAWFVFKESFDRRIALGMLSIVAGAVALNWQPQATANDLIGPAAIVGACLAWALDNNLTRKVSLSDPVQITMIKGLVAGPVSLGIGYLLGGALPPLATVGLGALTGFLGYGVSLVLFVLALRHLGTARTGAYFSLAPFVGAVVSIPLFGEAITVQLVLAGALMAFGAWQHLSERHEHVHEHLEFAHEHRHTHDDHHDHGHDGPVDPGQAHNNAHVHAPLRHSHPHTPDSHHRHAH